MVRAMLSRIAAVAVVSQSLCKLKDGSGRVAAHEIMLGTSAIRNLIRENKMAQMYSSIQTGQSIGMQTLDQNLTELVRRNLISPAEARARRRSREFPRMIGPPSSLTPAPPGGPPADGAASRIRGGSLKRLRRR